VAANQKPPMRGPFYPMAQNETGVRRALRVPAIYRGLQWLAGENRIYREFVEGHLRAKPGMRILDVGCGTGDIIDWLPKGVTYHGVDVNSAYIGSAARRFTGRGTFSVGRAEAVAASAEGSFDLVIGIGLLHHLNDDAVRSFLTSSLGLIEDTGRLVTIDPCLTNDQSWLAGVLVRRDRGTAVRAPERYADIVGQVFSVTNCHVRHNMGWIPWTHCILEATHPLANLKLDHADD